MRPLSALYLDITEFFNVLAWISLFVALGTLTSIVAEVEPFTFDGYIFFLVLTLFHFTLRLFFFFKHKRELEKEAMIGINTT